MIYLSTYAMCDGVPALVQQRDELLVAHQHGAERRLTAGLRPRARVPRHRSL
jgi:hypothetical protein